MNSICNSDKCVGCGVCVDICPKNAIELKYNVQGFLHPNIDNEKCIDCNKCVNHCPANKNHTNNKIDKFRGYMCWSKNDNTRINSSSGGIFSILANYAFDNNGVVYGASFNENLSLRHVKIEKQEELFQLRGSKYIQSDTSGIYKDVLEQLKNNRFVLFSGTPCQVVALHNFLGKDYSNIITCDFICHGVGSTKFFNNCINYLKQKYKSNPIDVKFRKKIYGWKKSSFEVSFLNRKSYKDYFNLSVFGYPYALKLINRESCASCQFATMPRYSDFTMADYGGDDYIIQDKSELFKGISTLIINNEKAEEVFDKIKNTVYYEQKTNEMIQKSSPYLQNKPSSNPNREQFFKDFCEKDFKIIKKTYCNVPIKERIKFVYDENRLPILYKIYKKIRGVK